MEVHSVRNVPLLKDCTHYEDSWEFLGKLKWLGLIIIFDGEKGNCEMNGLTNINYIMVDIHFDIVSRFGLVFIKNKKIRRLIQVFL